MKYAKAAAVVAGAVLALGAATPAFADSDKQLLNSDTKTTQDLKNPIGDLDVQAWIGSLEKVADKLAVDNSTNAKTKVGGR